MSKDKKEYGYEGEMAKSQLKGVIMHAKQLHDMLEPDTDLPEWVQSKITLAYDYIQTAADYMATELDEENINEGQGTSPKTHSSQEDYVKALRGHHKALTKAGYKPVPYDKAEVAKHVSGDARIDQGRNSFEYEKTGPTGLIHKRAIHTRPRYDRDTGSSVMMHVGPSYKSSQGKKNPDPSRLPEEVSLQELSKGLLDRYELKNERDRERLASGLWYRDGVEATEKQKKDSAKLDKRIAGRNLASMKTHPKVFDPKVTGRPGAKVHATEEAPANSAGGGAIDGIGVGPKGEPGVKPRAMKRYKDKNAAEAPKAGRKTLSLFMKGE